MALTVAEVFERYRAAILGRVAAGTARGYLVAWRHRVEPSFGTWGIESITTLDVENAYYAWSGADSTKGDALALLSAICRTAVKGGFIPTNPCVGVEKPRAGEGDPTSRALSELEISQLLAALPAAGPYRRFVLAMLLTGCRLGEIAGLRVSDVDTAEGVIAIRRTASPGLSGENVVGPTKGRRVRTVPIAAPLLPVVLEAMAGKGPHDVLFPGPRGGRVTSKNLSRALKWHAMRQGIKAFPQDERPLHWHDLRHTAAVMLFRSGVSAPDVQAILGHSSLAVTQIYADTRRDAAKRGASALSEYWQKSMGQPGGGEEPATAG